jgi:hypothetical protein
MEPHQRRPRRLLWDVTLELKHGGRAGVNGAKRGGKEENSTMKSTL